jgi:hypothetical protein
MRHRKRAAKVALWKGKQANRYTKPPTASGKRNKMEMCTETYKRAPISRPTDATCDRFLVACIHTTNQSIQTDAPLKASFLQDSAADRYKHRKLEAVCTVRDS